MANNIMLSTNVVVTLIIVWRGGMLNYSLLATFVHVHVLATSLFKNFNMVENLFFNLYFSSWFFWLLCGKFLPKKEAGCKIRN
jgi:hypothetical protein